MRNLKFHVNANHQDIVNKIVNKKYRTPHIDVRILVADDLPRDANKQSVFRENVIQLEALGINFHIIDDWHAKIWMTESVVALGSPNLNPINLGIRRPHGEWRANTEVLFVTYDSKEVAQANAEFESAFSQGTSATGLYQSKAEKDITNLLKARSIDARPSARQLLSFVATALQKARVADFNRVLYLSEKIQQRTNSKRLETIHVTSAIILWRLEKSEITLDQLKAFVQEMVGRDTEFDNALKLLHDELGFVNERASILSLNATKLFS